MEKRKSNFYSHLVSLLVEGLSKPAKETLAFNRQAKSLFKRADKTKDAKEYKRLTSIGNYSLAKVDHLKAKIPTKRKRVK